MVLLPKIMAALSTPMEPINVVSVTKEGVVWQLRVPDCHPAIFAKGEEFVANASPDDRAEAVMNAALLWGLDPSERGGWEQIWDEEQGAADGGRGGSEGPAGLAWLLGLTFEFSGRLLAYLPKSRRGLGDDGADTRK